MYENVTTVEEENCFECEYRMKGSKVGGIPLVYLILTLLGNQNMRHPQLAEEPLENYFSSRL